MLTQQYKTPSVTYNGVRSGPSSLADSHASSDDFQILSGTSPIIFERIATHDLKEVHEYHGVIESQQKRIKNLEKINMDLEKRLEVQAKQHFQIEKDIAVIDQRWQEKCNALQQEVSDLEVLLKEEQAKSVSAIEKFSRTERELHRMMQRKYDSFQTESKSSSSPGTTQQLILRDLKSQAERVKQQKSPAKQILTPPILSASDIRRKQVEENLLDFFGF